MAWLFFCLLLAGCGGPPPLAQVQGQVRFRGSPLPGGIIVFSPDAERGTRGQLALADIGPDGKFTLLTDGKPGCAPGWHRVTVASHVTSLPDRYRDPDLSGRIVEVKPGHNACEVNLD
jgi:hypothetical protein